MSNDDRDVPISYRVAGWIQSEKPWAACDSYEWTYKRGADGDLTVFAETPEEALATIAAHGFRNLDPKKLVKTGDKLTDYLKVSEK